MFTVLEGPDGAGKTTMGRRLAEKIDAHYHEFPDRSTTSGVVIDRMLKGEIQLGAGGGPHGYPAAHDHAIVLQALMSVNKFEALSFLSSDRCPRAVFSRWVPSALVYGAVDGCDVEWLERIHRGLPAPDLCLLLDVPEDVSIQRLYARGYSESYERNRVRITRVRTAYLDLWAKRRKSGDGNWIVVDASQPPDAVFDEIVAWYEARRVRSLWA